MCIVTIIITYSKIAALINTVIILKTSLFIFLLLPLQFFAQQRQPVTGKIAYGSFKTAPMLVVNVSAGKETYTDSIGNFKTDAQTGDLFAVNGSRVIGKKIRYTPDLVKNGIFIITTELQVTEIDEVVINKNNISAENLGLVPKGQKKYTTAERRLETAGDFKPIHLLGLLAGSLEVDPIINAINGKTKRLKKEIKIEAKLALIAKIKDIYTPEELESKFKILAIYSNGYLYYISEDESLATAVNKDDEAEYTFIMSRLAAEYLEIIKNDE